MLIQSAIYNKNNNQTNFGNLQKKVFKPLAKGCIVPEFSHNCDTAVYRQDMDWNKLVKFISNKFKDVLKVGFYNYGCSNLSEAYTFLIQMFSDFGANMVKKFTPIVAKDRDLSMIIEARDEYLPMNLEEVKMVNMNTGRKFIGVEKDEKYFNEFLYLYEPVLNRNARLFIKKYAKRNRIHIQIVKRILLKFLILI